MKSFVALVSALVVVAVAALQAEAIFDQINKYLIRKVASPDVDQNLNASVEWLKEQETAKHSLGCLSLFSKNPVPELKKFTALQQAYQSPKCDRDEFNALRANQEAVNLHQLKDDGKVIRRVDTVMLEVFKVHAQKCQTVYPQVYKTKKEQVDKAMFDRVEKFGKSVRHYVKFYKNFDQPEHLFKYILFSSTNFAGLENIYRKTLLKVAKDDPNVKYASKVPDENTGKAVIHKDKIKQLVTDYLLDPCIQYVEYFGQDVFSPASFDSRVYLETGIADQEYYDGWEYFRICQGVMSIYPSTLVHDIMKSEEGRN